MRYKYRQELINYYSSQRMQGKTTRCYGHQYKKGSIIKFTEEPDVEWTVKAYNGRYIICTTPNDLETMVFYTIIDLQENIRSPNNRMFNPYDYTKQSDIDKSLKDLISGDLELSRRNQLPLNIIQ